MQALSQVHSWSFGGAFIPISLVSFLTVVQPVSSRNGVIGHGVVTTTRMQDGREKVVCIVSFGEIWENLPEDILFSIPNFVDPIITARCGSATIAENDHQIAARVKVLKQLRSLENQLEQEYFSITGHLGNVYHKVRSSDPNEWAQVTTMEVVNMIAEGKPPSLIRTLAVHQHLMRRSAEFVASSTQFRATNTFWVRPKAHLDEIQAVEQMIKKGDELGEFIAKAQKIIAENRAKTELTLSEPPRQESVDRTPFNRNDLRIIRFLQNSIRTKRSIQLDPYIIPTSILMKKLGLYSGEVRDDMVSEFLVDLGVFTPWYDPVTCEEDMMFLKHGGATEDNLPKASQQVSQIHKTLGPDDLYSSDMAESVRHDFGDLPVYVIDDFGAKELDDGVSIQEIPLEPASYWIHVHVADPTLVLPPTHRYAQQAFRQSTSLYFVHETVPLIPPTVPVGGVGSEATLGKPEKVMTFSFKIDRHGEIKDYKVRAGIVKNVKTLKYDDVDTVLGTYTQNGGYTFPFGGESSRSFTPTQFNPDEIKDLKRLYSVAQRLVKRRVENGVIASNTQAAEIKATPHPLLPNPSILSERIISTGFPKLVYSVGAVKQSELGARRLVAECMKAAARVASRFFRDRGIPATRRSAGRMVATDADFADLLNERDADGFVPYQSLVQRNATYPHAEYTLRPAGHWQLGVPEGEGYCRVTSPLRRFGDLLAHWQIKHALVYPQAKPLFSEEWLQAFCVDSAFRDVRLRKLLKSHHTSWAMKFITRWVNHPELHKDKEDPLQNLMAIRVGALRQNTLDGCWMCQVHIPTLGLYGLMTGLSVDEVVSFEPVPVHISSVRLGLKPLVWVTRK